MIATIVSLLLSIILASAAPVNQPLPADSSVYLMTVISEYNATTPQLEKRELYGTSSSEGSLCRAVTILFARGTFEPGNVGLLAGKPKDIYRHPCNTFDKILGPPFFDALASMIGDATLGVQGVPYPATIAGYLEQGDPVGSATFGQMADQIASQCPDTKLVLSGYSQGAQLVHNGAAKVAPSTAAKVVAVVLCKRCAHGRTMYLLTCLQSVIRLMVVLSRTSPRTKSRLSALKQVSKSLPRLFCPCALSINNQ